MDETKIIGETMRALKALAIIMTLLGFISQIKAEKLSDYTPYKYEVLFTNPLCKTYKYTEPLMANNGEMVFSKTKNAYCKRGDSRRSGQRNQSPLKRILDWIKQEDTKEVFLAYLSFSQRKVAGALCDAVKNRNVKVTLILDRRNEEDEGRMATANFLANCKPSAQFENPNLPIVKTSGHQGRGRNKVGYAHNKVLIINPASKKKIQIAFSSGNMSSGTVTHHENWHFVTTNSKTNFAQTHLCLMDGVQKADQGIKEYSQFIKNCRSKIQTPLEEDIQVFFVPGEGELATRTILKAMSKSTEVQMAAHRFSYNKLIDGLKRALAKKTKVRLIVDDDIYWTGKRGKGTGRNNLSEYGKVNRLRKAGMRVHYLETFMDDIEEPKSLQLQHNKFLIFHFGSEDGGVFTGAGNLTGAAFKSNFENFYYIQIPEVVAAFKKQYTYMWNDLTRDYFNMPSELVLP